MFIFVSLLEIISMQKDRNFMKISLAVLFVFMVLVGCQNPTNENASGLPVYGFKTLVEKEIDGKKVVDSIDHTIDDFSFVNQDSTIITEKDIAGKIYLADFFFTSCFTICPKVKKQMKRVYDKYKGNPDFLILSHSIDYRRDTVARLAWYADKFNIESDNWHLLHGSYDELLRMSYQYLLTALEDDGAPGGFDHSGSIALVDRKKRIRGMYDGTDPASVDQLMEDIQLLMDKE